MAEQPNRTISEEESEFCRLIVYDRLPKYQAYMQVWGCKKITAPAQASKKLQQKRVQEELKRLRDMKSQESEWEFDDSVDQLKGIVMNPENQTVQVNALKELNKMFGWDKQTIDHNHRIVDDGSNEW